MQESERGKRVPVVRRQLTGRGGAAGVAVEDVAGLLGRGQEARRSGETLMNSESSRSHSVFTAELSVRTVDDSGITSLLSSRLNLVDLAGGEPPLASSNPPTPNPIFDPTPRLLLACAPSLTRRGIVQSFHLHQAPPPGSTQRKSPGSKSCVYSLRF